MIRSVIDTAIKNNKQPLHVLDIIASCDTAELNMDYLVEYCKFDVQL